MRKLEKADLEIRDEATPPDIRDEELDRVSGGGNNSSLGHGAARRPVLNEPWPVGKP